MSTIRVRTTALGEFQCTVGVCDSCPYCGNYIVWGADRRGTPVALEPWGDSETETEPHFNHCRQLLERRIEFQKAARQAVEDYLRAHPETVLRGGAAMQIDEVHWLNVVPAAHQAHKFPGWAMSVAMTSEGTVYLPAALAGNETLVLLCLAWDGAESLTNEGHVYAPSYWLEREFPYIAPTCNAIEKRIRSFFGWGDGISQTGDRMTENSNKAEEVRVREHFEREGQKKGENQ